MKGISIFKRIAGAIIIAWLTTIAYAQVPVGAPQAFVSSVVAAGGQGSAPTAAPEGAAVTTGAAPAGKGPKPSPFLFATAPYFGISIAPRTNYNRAPAVYRALEGTLSLGVEALLTKWLYLGGEVFLGNSMQIFNQRNFEILGNVNRLTNVKSTWSYGFDIIPGALVSCYVLGYLRIGVSSTHFPGQRSSSTAWRLGVGGEGNVFCKKWYLRMECIYSSYNGMSHVGKLRGYQTNIGLVYKFL